MPTQNYLWRCTLLIRRIQRKTFLFPLVLVAVLVLALGITSILADDEGSVSQSTSKIEGSNRIMQTAKPIVLEHQVKMLPTPALQGRSILYLEVPIARGRVSIENVSPYPYLIQLDARPEEIIQGGFPDFVITVEQDRNETTFILQPKETWSKEVEVVVPAWSPTSTFRGLVLVADTFPPPEEKG